MQLPKSAYNWALKHLVNEGDTDLFPTLFEIEALQFRKNWKIILDSLAKLDVTHHIWKGGRTFVVPKARFVFRVATQLDPIDSLILAALMRQIGNKIESARVPVSENRVFSYRFAPTKDGRFYGQTTGWDQFWEESLRKSKMPNYNWVAITDITDFYNQIYHHKLENQLQDIAGNETQKAIKGMLQSITNKGSRGIPIGPHSTHLLAECVLNTIDQSLLSHGYDYCRYVDDIHIFCKTEQDAEIALYDFATILDNQKLTVQKQKTRIISVENFAKYAQQMTEDSPVNKEEAEILKIIANKTSGDPYRQIKLDTLTDDDLKHFQSKEIIKIFEIYLGKEEVDYPRIGWLLRRLAQIGIPTALDFVLDHLESLMPVIGNAATYIMSAARNYDGDMVALGQQLLSALDNNQLIRRSEYLQIVLLDVFSRVPALNNIEKLTKRYSSSTLAVRRELVRVATTSNKGQWLSELKNEFKTADPWLRPALIAAARTFPGDEGSFWIKHIRKQRFTALEYLISKWALKELLKKDEIHF